MRTRRLVIKRQGWGMEVSSKAGGPRKGEGIPMMALGFLSFLYLAASGVRSSLHFFCFP